MAITKLAPNLAAHVTPKYIDLVPGNYGPQVRIKGQVDDDDNAMLFLPGKIADVLHALIQGGVIANQGYDVDTEKPLAIKSLVRGFLVTNAIPAGEKYGTLKIVDTAPQPPASTSAAKHPPALARSDDGYMDALAHTVAPVTASPSDPVLTLYMACMKQVLDHVVPLWQTGDVVIDASAINAATATLMIARQRAA